MSFDLNQLYSIGILNKYIHIHLDGPDEWGGISANGSSSGMIGSVYKGFTDFGIGCYYNWYNDDFETSGVIAKSAVGLVGPAPQRFPPYLINILPFNGTIWSLIIFSMFVSSLIMHAIKFSSFDLRRRRNPKDMRQFHHLKSYLGSVLDIFSIFVQQTFDDS